MTNRSSTPPVSGSTSDEQAGPTRRTGTIGLLSDNLPGLLFCLAIAGLSLAAFPALGVANFSPALAAFVLGAAVGGSPADTSWASAGSKFAQRTILKIGVSLLGLQITIAQVLAIGLWGLAMIVLGTISAFSATLFLGRLLKIDQPLTQLIAAGTSICGASAIVATSTVSRTNENDVAYAIACVSIIGSVMLFIYPAIAELLHLSDIQYGLWAGASLHEVAQVAAATIPFDDAAGTGMVAKLARVLLLAPIVFAVAAIARDDVAEKAGGVAIPWFLVAFAALVGCRSTGMVPDQILSVSGWISSLFIAASLVAIGLEIRLNSIRERGWRPFALAVIVAIGLSAGTLTWVLGMSPEPR